MATAKRMDWKMATTKITDFNNSTKTMNWNIAPKKMDENMATTKTTE